MIDIYNETKQGLKKITLFNKKRHYSIQIVNKITFFKYRTRQIKATETYYK